jgi:hypothetical protein
MKKFFRFLVLLLFIGVLVGACKDEEYIDPAESLSPIVDVTLPEVGYVNQEINFIVSHAVFNGCGFYSSRKTIMAGNSLVVTFYAKYRDGICTMDIPIRKTNYQFMPKRKGTYTFKFNKGDNTFLTKEIIII